MKWVFLFFQLPFSWNSIIYVDTCSTAISSGPAPSQGGATVTVVVAQGRDWPEEQDRDPCSLPGRPMHTIQGLLTGWSPRVTARGPGIKHSGEVYFKGTRNANPEGERRCSGLAHRDWVTGSWKVSQPPQLPGRGSMVLRALPCL